MLGVDTMIKRQSLNRFVATVAVTGMLVGAIASFSHAQNVLQAGDNVRGWIQNNSPAFTFTNPSVSEAPAQTARGTQYTFSAQRGETIEISVTPQPGSTLRPVLVLFDSSGRQVGFNATSNLLTYRVPRTGTYRLLVLGGNNTRGRYTLAMSGSGSSTSPTPVSQADQVMNDVLRLRIIGCGVPNVARIVIGNEERCTRDIEPGVYTYDASTRRITLVDSRRELLAQRLQLNILERCPVPATSVAQIVMTDPQDGRDYTYCATPTRFVKAGAYRYNPTTDDLLPLSSTPVSPQPPTATQPDSRRQLLQTEYGLTVLDGCPAARTGLVVISFPENNQTYIYCANPNRLVRAGEYTYNPTTGNLDTAQQAAPACTVSIGGVCLVK